MSVQPVAKNLYRVSISVFIVGAIMAALAIINWLVSYHNRGYNLVINTSIAMGGVELIVCVYSAIASYSKNYIFTRNTAIIGGFPVLLSVARTILLIYILNEVQGDSNVYGLEWAVVVLSLLFLGGYSAMFALLVKHAIRNKKEAEAATYDMVEQTSHSEQLTAADPKFI